jgi:hypothetical protein
MHILRDSFYIAENTAVRLYTKLGATESDSWMNVYQVQTLREYIYHDDPIIRVSYEGNKISETVLKGFSHNDAWAVMNHMCRKLAIKD